jgi:type IX secretion system PorP/SprF family membrane protein
LKTDHYDLNVKTTATERMHINVMAGYVFQLNKHVKFKPAMLVKAVSGAPLAIDASANFLLYDQITIGASYRKDAAISAMFGFQISNSLMIGYAYDFDTTELANYNSGSHEIVLRFDLIREIISLSPRFF